YLPRPNALPWPPPAADAPPPAWAPAALVIAAEFPRPRPDACAAAALLPRPALLFAARAWPPALVMPALEAAAVVGALPRPGWTPTLCAIWPQPMPSLRICSTPL